MSSVHLHLIIGGSELSCRHVLGDRLSLNIVFEYRSGIIASWRILGMLRLSRSRPHSCRAARGRRQDNVRPADLTSAHQSCRARIGQRNLAYIDSRSERRDMLVGTDLKDRSEIRTLASIKYSMKHHVRCVCSLAIDPNVCDILVSRAIRIIVRSVLTCRQRKTSVPEV